MKSSWDHTRERSQYHFDSKRVDHKNDVIQTLGRLPVTWAADIPAIVDNSRPATWATRGYKGQGVHIPSADLAAEEYDISRVGADPNMIITDLNWEIPNSLQQITELFALDDCMQRIHVQWPGQVWNLHIDKLQKWAPDRPDTVSRYFVQLTDWQPGQFWEYGNYHWNQWSAGDVSTFDWPNTPHSTANAGHHPRVTFQLTGVRTDRTEEFLEYLRSK